MRILPFLFFTLLFSCGKKFDQVRDEPPLFTATGAAEAVYQPPPPSASKGIYQIQAEQEMGYIEEKRKDYVLKIYGEAITEFLNLKKMAFGKLPKTLSDYKSDSEFINIMNSIPLNFWNVRDIYKDKDFVAVCKKSSKTGQKEILVDREYWFEDHPELRMALVLHELGHCAQGLDHKGASGNCRYIMEPSLISFYNQKTRNILGKEIFVRSNPCAPLDLSLQKSDSNQIIYLPQPKQSGD